MASRISSQVWVLPLPSLITAVPSEMLLYQAIRSQVNGPISIPYQPEHPKSLFAAAITILAGMANGVVRRKKKVDLLEGDDDV